MIHFITITHHQKKDEPFSSLAHQPSANRLTHPSAISAIIHQLSQPSATSAIGYLSHWLPQPSATSAIGYLSHRLPQPSAIGYLSCHSSAISAISHLGLHPSAISAIIGYLSHQPSAISAIGHWPYRPSAIGHIGHLSHRPSQPSRPSRPSAISAIFTSIITGSFFWIATPWIKNCSKSVDLKTKLLSCNFLNKQTNEFVFLFWWLSCQDRKTKLSVCFLREVTARQFCFEIYRPLAILW